MSFSEIRVLKIARIVPFILFGNYFDFWQKIKNEKNKNLVSVYWPASKSADAEIQLRRESDLLDLQICWTSDLLDSQFCWITQKSPTSLYSSSEPPQSKSRFFIPQWRNSAKAGDNLQGCDKLPRPKLMTQVEHFIKNITL